jgi:HK97 family phage prohead protease
MEPDKRPKPGQLEERQAPELEVDGKKIRGRIPYGVESRDLGGFREVIERGALNRTKFDDLVVTVDHAGLPLGRFPGTLELEDRDDGLHWSVDPPNSRADIREAIERGDLKGGSWRMVVGKDRWEDDVRHVEEIELLRDVAIVTRPAYESAAVELRSHDNNDAAEVRQKENTMTDEVRDGGLEVEDRHEKQERPPAGSLRVEERTVKPDIGIKSLAELVRDRGFGLEQRTAAVIGFDEFRSFTWAAGTVLTGVNRSAARARRWAMTDAGYIRCCRRRRSTAPRLRSSICGRRRGRWPARCRSGRSMRPATSRRRARRPSWRRCNSSKLPP